MQYFLNKRNKKIPMDQIHRLGVTAIYAAGKSTICSIFQELGAHIIDLDVIAKMAVEKGSDCHRRVVAYFKNRGFQEEQFLEEDGNLNRREVAKIVFNNKSDLAALNSMVHPAAIEMSEKIMDEKLKENPNRKFVLDIPLLFESKLEDWVDIIIVVSVPMELAIERGMKRDKLSRNQVLSRIKNQIPLNEKIPKADYVIENMGTIEQVREKVTKIWNNLAHYTA